jgi:hypothetical protein
MDLGMAAAISACNFGVDSAGVAERGKLNAWAVVGLANFVNSG